jgi:RNA polymerase sigma factor (sigma-70 family)
MPPSDGVPTSADEQAALIRVAQTIGSAAEAAQNLIATAYTPLIESTVREIAAGQDYDVQDEARSAGYRALLVAVQRFDPQHGYTLATFARKYVRGGVIRVLKAEAAVQRHHISLDDKTFSDSPSGEEMSLVEVLASDYNLEEQVMADLETPERKAVRGRAIEATNSFVDALPATQQHVVRRVFYDGWSQAAVARETGVSRNAVNKMLGRIYERGRAELAPFGQALFN